MIAGVVGIAVRIPAGRSLAGRTAGIAAVVHIAAGTGSGRTAGNRRTAAGRIRRRTGQSCWAGRRLRPE